MLRMLSVVFSLTLIVSSVAVANERQQAKAPEHPSIADTNAAPTIESMGSTAASNSKSAAPIAAPKADPSHMAAKPAAVHKQTAASEMDANAKMQDASKIEPKAKEIKAAQPTKDVQKAQQSEMTVNAEKQAAKDTSAMNDKPAAADMEKQAATDLEVVDFVLAGKVEAREPQEVVETFGKDNERGFAFARLHAKTASEITFVWYRNDQPVARFKQPIQAAKKWRTYSSVKLRPGQWKVQLLTEDKVLAEKTFTIE